MNMDSFKDMRCPRCGESRLFSDCNDMEWITDDMIFATGMLECPGCGWSARYTQTLRTIEGGIEIEEEDEEGE